MARGRTRKSTAKSFGDFKSRKSLQMPGGSSRDLDRERESTRQQYFSGRTDVPASRLDKRKIQADTVDQFKKDFLKPIEEVTQGPEGFGRFTRNLEANAPMSLEQFREQTARQYGPTNKEVMGDIGSGLGNLIKSYGIPFVSPIMKGMNVIKSGVEAAWDAVRGEPSQQTFPEFTGESENYFNNIDTGIAAGDPDNLLVQIAKENEGRFDNNQTFEERLANATAMNLNVPSIGDILVKTNDALNQAKAGVNIATPLGVVNVNPLAERVFLSGGAGNIGYGGSFNPNTSDYNLGISTALPGDFRLSAGTSSNDLPGVSLSNTYLPKIFGTDIRGMGNVVPSVNMSGQGDLSLGVNTTVDPLKMFGVESAIPFNIGVGAKVNQQGGFSPNLNFNVPFNSSGLGYMFK